MIGCSKKINYDCLISEKIAAYIHIYITVHVQTLSIYKTIIDIG
jgi:hypothetical protein